MKRARASGTRGAVYVEFCIAIVPFILFFFSLIQLALLASASLVVDHAAVCAARAAIVVLHDSPQFYNGQAQGEAKGQRLDDVTLAGAMPLLGIPNVQGVRVTFPTAENGTDSRTTFGPHDLVRVRVEADYHCLIPLASRIVCDATTAITHLHAEAVMPNQGASYPPLYGPPVVKIPPQGM